MASSAPTRVWAPAALTRTIEPRPEVRGAGIDRVALPHGNRGGFAGQHGVVERRAAGQDDAIDGNQFAGADLDPVAGRERGERHLDNRRVGARPGELAGEFEEGGAAQAVGAFERRPLGAALDLPGAEQRRDEHRERIEPDRSAAADDVPGAGREGDGERDRDGKVDVHEPGPKAGERRLEERTRREHEHRDRDGQRQPAEERVVRGRHPGVLAGIEGPVEEHEVHRAGRRHAEPRQ